MGGKEHPRRLIGELLEFGWGIGRGIAEEGDPIGGNADHKPGVEVRRAGCITPMIDAKHVGATGSHRDESDTLWLDGKDTRP